jgi:GAF domain-containing protein
MKIFGVINLSTRKGNFFSLDDLKFLRVFSFYASIVIENARLFSNTMKITDSIIKHATLLDMT